MHLPDLDFAQSLNSQSRVSALARNVARYTRLGLSNPLALSIADRSHLVCHQYQASRHNHHAGPSKKQTRKSGQELEVFRRYYSYCLRQEVKHDAPHIPWSKPQNRVDRSPALHPVSLSPPTAAVHRYMSGVNIRQHTKL